MTNFSKQKIIDRFDNFNQYLKYLRQLQKEIGGEKEFISDFHLFGVVERYLQLTIQAILDISHQIIIDSNLKTPKDNYEAIAILFGKKIISDNLARKIPR